MKNEKGFASEKGLKSFTRRKSHMWARNKILITAFLLFGEFLMFGALPALLWGDESDFGPDANNAYSVADKKATLVDYKGNFFNKTLEIRPRSEKVFPEQKLFIGKIGERGGCLLYNDEPISLFGKVRNTFTHLLFSTDHRTALAYGPNSGMYKGKQAYFLNGSGKIISTVDMDIESADISAGSFVGKCFEPNSKHEIPKFYLCKWDFDGLLIWKKEIVEGNFGESSYHSFSVANNGKFIIAQFNKRPTEQNGSTRIYDENGNELMRFPESYFSFIENSNETAVLVSHKRARVLNLKKRTTIYKEDVTINSADVLWPIKSDAFVEFGPNDNDRFEKVPVAWWGPQGLEKIIIFDTQKMILTRFDFEPEEIGRFTKVYWSDLEKKIIFEFHDQKHTEVYEAINIEK